VEVVIIEVPALVMVKKQISQKLRNKILVSVTISYHQYGIVIDFLIFCNIIKKIM